MPEPAEGDGRLRYGIAAVAFGALLLTVALVWRPVAPAPSTVVDAPSASPPPSRVDPTVSPAVPPPVTAPAAGPQGPSSSPQVQTSGRGTGGVTGGSAPRPTKPTRPRAEATAPANPETAAPSLPARLPATAAPTTWPFRVITDPMGATIAVDGVTVGTSPRTLRLAPGAHRVRLTLEGTVVESDVLAGEGMASGFRHDFTTGSGSTLR